MKASLVHASMYLFISESWIDNCVFVLDKESHILRYPWKHLYFEWFPTAAQKEPLPMFSPPPLMPLSERKTWIVSPAGKAKYDEIVLKTDTDIH